MNRQDALRQVAGHTAALMSAGTFEEATGIEGSDLDALSETDEGRLGWAVEEVQRRLRAMGQPRTTKRRG